MSRRGCSAISVGGWERRTFLVLCEPFMFGFFWGGKYVFIDNVLVEVFFGGDGVSSFVRLRCDRPIY